MMAFAESLDLVNAFNEPLFDYLTDKKIPVVYVTPEKLKTSALLQKTGVPKDALFWCAYYKVRDKEMIIIYVNLTRKAMYEIARTAMQSKEPDLMNMLESILTHETIHAYLFSLGFQNNIDWQGRCMILQNALYANRNLTKNKFILYFIDVIRKSNQQEIITYVATEKIFADFFKTFNIEKQNAWIAWCESVNRFDPFGIIIKYARKMDDIPAKIIAESNIKYKLYKMKGDTFERPEIIEEMKDGGIIVDNDGSDGGKITGEPHSNGGVDAVIIDTGKPLELEAGEVVIKKSVVSSGKKYKFEGKQMTPKQILNKLNTDGGGNRIK